MNAGVQQAIGRALEELERSQVRQFRPGTAERLAEYVEDLHAYNRIHRVVGPATAEEIAREHVVDSLELLRHVRGPLVDVGSGAGLPGLVLALAAPELQTTLIEPRNKPAAFLSLTRARFGLEQVQILDRRVEEVAVSDLAGGEAARCLVAKGYGPLAKLVETARHLAAGDAVFLVPSSSAECPPPGVAEPHGFLPHRHVHVLRPGQAPAPG